MELNKSIRLAVDSGKVEFGFKTAKKSSLNGDGKLILIASNCPAEFEQDLNHYCKLSQLPMLKVNMNSMELGVLCGKPFPVAAMTVFEAGDSDILEAAAQSKQ